MRLLRGCSAAGAALWLAWPTVAAPQPNPVSVEDAIELQRIRRPFGTEEETAYFSADGTRFVCVLWKGDLERNVNVYSLVLFDLRGKAPTMRTLLKAEFTSDKLRRNQSVAPISQISFLGDDRTVTFLGSLRGEEPQVYAVDTETGETRPLTHHPTAVRSYGLSPDGRVRVFSAMAQPNGSECRSLYAGGVSLFDQRLQVPRTLSYLSRRTREPGRSAEVFDLSEAIEVVTGRRCEPYGWTFLPAREYFIVPEAGGVARPLLDDADAHMATRLTDDQMIFQPNLVISASGTHALLFPSREAERSQALRYSHLRGSGPRSAGAAAIATSLALIDLRTRQSRPLSPVPVQRFSRTRILWSPDSRFVVMKSLLPLDADSDAENERRASLPPQLAEIDVSSGRVAPIEAAAGADPVSMLSKGELIVREGNRLLRLRKEGERWSGPTLIADLDRAGLNGRYRASTNGTILVGVKDGLTIAPEIATYDPESGAMKVLTDLNPALRERAFGPVEKVFWKGKYDDASFGYLIKPVGFVEGRRYPLVILFKDSPADPLDESYLIDGQEQLSGHAAQTLAGVGFVVLFTPAAPSMRSVMGKPEEVVHVVAHVESGIDYLDGRGLVDRSRVGIAGWSRAAFWTDYVLMHSSHPFKAGIHIDGGGNYEWFLEDICRSAARSDGACDRNYEKLSAARLSQQHGPGSGLVSEMGLVTKLRNLAKAIDVYTYPDEPHDLRTPSRRHHSLSLNVDWYRFWLQDFEDPDPAKREQYERWRRLRALQSGVAVERR